MLVVVVLTLIYGLALNRLDPEIRRDLERMRDGRIGNDEKPGAA